MFRSSTSKADIDSRDTIEELTNQTRFSSEEPLFENPPFITSSSTAPVEPVQKKKFSPLLLLGGGVIGLVVILLVAVVVFSPKRQNTPVSVEPITQQAVENESTELTRRLSEVEADLKAADPVKVDLPFPPVSFSIYLDAPPR